MIAPSTEHAVANFRLLVREANADRAVVQARYDIACEIIVKNITGGTCERAHAMVEHELRMRGGLVEEKAT